jgi:aminoglycoside 6'-N-acetyltransferase
VARAWIDRPCAPAVLVAVVAANTASWRTLQKAGLRRIAEGPITPDNPIDDPLITSTASTDPHNADRSI